MTTKPFDLPKSLFVKAYRFVRQNAGSAGIDERTLDAYAQDLENNLYRLWNRMSSGSYFPPPVKAVAIPKRSGGERLLGIPTVEDRIAQTVVKLVFEPEVEAIFLPDSYGYRPHKSALEAIGVTRQRCFAYDWVLEFDIKGLFDHLPHDLLMKAVRKHAKTRWELLYIERWLKAPLQMPDGTQIARTSGTPQGGVISPVLSNLFLHYTFDAWMKRHHPKTLWCRYADDGLVHCKTQREAESLLEELTARFSACGLTLHPEKTKIVYCKDANRPQDYPHQSFDFLGYTFQARRSKNRQRNCVFVAFLPAVSKEAKKSMGLEIKRSGIRYRTDLSLQEIAHRYNRILQGWINYYGAYNRSALYPVWRYFNKTLVIWARRKYKSLGNSKTRAGRLMSRIVKAQPTLFAHWRAGMIGAFA